MNRIKPLDQVSPTGADAPNHTVKVQNKLETRCSIFDMAGGRFLDTPPTAHSRWLEAHDAAALYALQRITLTNSHLFAMNRQQRARALDLALQYYSLHYAPLSRLQSLDILRGMAL